MVIPADFEDAAPFSKGVARVKKGGSVFYIDESGQCVRDCPVSPSRPDPGQEDEDAWNAALANGKEEAFNAYLKRFPKGKYSEQARQKLRDIDASRQAARDARDEAAWNTAARQNTVAAYDAYLQQFPKGIYYQQAQARRTELTKKEQEKKMREEAVWKQVSQQNTIKDYQLYQRQYPNGTYYQEARRRINALCQWGNCKWVSIGAQKSHQAGAPWLPNGYLITTIDLDGPREYGEHDSPVIGRVRACNLEGVQWGDCKWIPVGPQKSHQSGSPWLPKGYYISQIDLDGFKKGRAHDSPVIGQVRACRLAGFSGWADCQWIKIGATNSHQGAGQWCPNGYFITQIDLDGDSKLASHDSPFIGQIKCCKPAQ